MPQSDVDQFALVDRSGCYVLGATFDQGWRYVLSEGGRKGPISKAMVVCRADEVDIDFSGRGLKSVTGLGGVAAEPGRSGGHTSVPRTGGGQPHRVILRNGFIDLSQSDGRRTSPAVSCGESEPLFHFDAVRYPIPSPFRKVEYVLENLTIKAKGEAALLFGDGITIRHCRIEVEGENAIVIYGPNAVIEDNHIAYRFSDANPGLVTAGYPKRPGFHPQIRSAIYLRAAPGAVVRRNTVSIELGDPAACAISAVDSQGVVVIGNTFNRRQASVRLHGQSSASLRDNRVGTEGLLTKAEALPDEDLK